MKYTKQYLKDNKIAIRCENQNEANSVFLLFKGHDCDWSTENTCFAVDDGCGAIFFREVDCESDGLSIVSYSEFVQDTRKIIGYRCPFDMYKRTSTEYWVKKGDLYIFDPIFASNGYVNKKYQIDKNQRETVSLFYLPAEIVEQWEPVYEEVKPCFGSFDDLICYLVKKGEKFESIKFGDEIIDKSKYAFTPEFEQKLKEMGINI